MRYWGGKSLKMLPTQIQRWCPTSVRHGVCTPYTMLEQSSTQPVYHWIQFSVLKGRIRRWRMFLSLVEAHILIGRLQFELSHWERSWQLLMGWSLRKNLGRILHPVEDLQRKRKNMFRSLESLIMRLRPGSIFILDAMTRELKAWSAGLGPKPKRGCGVSESHRWR